jgi:dienelactone hydrolase
MALLAAAPPAASTRVATDTVEYLSRAGAKPTQRDAVLLEQLREKLRRRKDPFRDLRGDLHLAYRSSVDQKLQPFRLYIPKPYKPGRPMPLIVALHGATVDENWYFDRFGGPSEFTTMAERRGYLVAAPNGRGPLGGYLGKSERDVLDVLDAVCQLVSVDTGNVFLTGHSMGGGGTWTIGFRHPERFRALAPVSGAFALSLLPLHRAPDMPVLHIHGGMDRVIPVASAQAAAAIARQRLRNYQFELIAGAGHASIAQAALPLVFDFFDSHRAGRRRE